MATMVFTTVALFFVGFEIVCSQQQPESNMTTSPILDAIQELRKDLQKDFKKQLKVLKKGLKKADIRRQEVEEKLDMCLVGAERMGLLATTTESTPSTTTTMPLWEHVCEDSFIRFEDHCYYYDTMKKDWSDAREACDSKGAQLVSVNSQAEQDFLVSNIHNDKSSYWLGMYHVPPGKLMWMDGTYVNYTAWGQGQPSCMKSCKPFLSHSYDHKWEDAGRSYDMNSVCETDKLLRVPYRPTTTTVTSTTTEPISVCPPGYIAFQGHCYLFEMTEVRWSRANEVCERLGAYLVSINTETEQEFLVTQIREWYNRGSNRYWLGMSYEQDEGQDDQQDEGTLRWADGTDVNYTAWSEGEPGCMEQGCKPQFSASTSYRWEDVGTSRYKRYYVCERDQLPIGNKSTE